jgi:hypothetical protein
MIDSDHCFLCDPVQRNLTGRPEFLMLHVWCSCQSLQLLGNDSLLRKSVLKGKEEGQ